MRDDMNDIVVLQPRSKRTWSVKSAQSELGSLKKHLLFAHAMSGCDTTSAIFGKGKTCVLRKIEKSPVLQQCSEVISNEASSNDEVGHACSDAFKVIYGGRKDHSMEKIL